MTEYFIKTTMMCIDDQSSVMSPTLQPVWLFFFCVYSQCNYIWPNNLSETSANFLLVMFHNPSSVGSLDRFSTGVDCILGGVFTPGSAIIAKSKKIYLCIVLYVISK